MRGEDGFGGGVVEVVGHVGEEGSAGLQEFDDLDGFGEVGVAGVRGVAERVEDQEVEVLEERDGGWREVAHVGEVGGRAEAIAGDGFAAVSDGDALEVCAEEGDGRAGFGGERIEFDAGAGGVAVDGAEGVVEDAADDFGGGLVGVEGEVFWILERQGAEVVHAEDMVGVVVGVEDGVDAGDGFAEGLGVEVGAGVDEDVAVVVGEEDGGAGAAVLGGRLEGVLADHAGAAERGDTHRGAATQEREGGVHAFCLESVWRIERAVPQRLKPDSFYVAYGTAEAVPLTRR